MSRGLISEIMSFFFRYIVGGNWYLLCVLFGVIVGVRRRHFVFQARDSAPIFFDVFAVLRRVAGGCGGRVPLSFLESTS